MENAISAAGFLVFMSLAWTLSRDRKAVTWRPVIGGMAMQLAIGVTVFLLPVSRKAFLKFSDIFAAAIESSRAGMEFVFGSLAKQGGGGFILAFQALPFIIVFAALMGLLFHWGVIPLVVKSIARVVSKALAVSGAESLCAASNIFVGIESATAVRPYIERMTRSELFIVLVAGMSTIASSVLAIYVSFLKDCFPGIAGHLVSASLISVPACFAVGKLMEPETGSPETMEISKCEMHSEGDAKSSMEALMGGAASGAKLAMGVAVSLIAFIGILGMLRAGAGSLTGDPIFIERMLSYAFYPFTWLMGIQPHDVPAVSMMLGKRLILTEIPSYIDLAAFGKAGGSPRTMLITSYALCGFTHVASMAIFAGGISALAPSRAAEIAKIAPKALLGATVVTMMTGAVAGIFYWGQQGVIG